MKRPKRNIPAETQHETSRNLVHRKRDTDHDVYVNIESDGKMDSKENAGEKSNQHHVNVNIELGKGNRSTPSRPPNCSPRHQKLVDDMSKQCDGAKDSYSNLCGVFSKCMEDVHTSYWICKTNLCTEFKSTEKSISCLKSLFNC
ncbi:hypothetical protein Q1695_010683 [Nippostrongylus brasiliensis]|nr:hypothetical protein Q1695_010683 [Nippostrongylus brasiliensis]